MTDMNKKVPMQYKDGPIEMVALKDILKWAKANIEKSKQMDTKPKK